MSSNNSTSPTSPRDPTTSLPPTAPPTIPPATPPSTPPATPPATLPGTPPPTPPPNATAPSNPETTILETVPPVGSTIVVTSTSTSTPPTTPGSTFPTSTDPLSTSGSAKQSSANGLVDGGGSSGMTGTTTVVVAVVVPIIGVALIAMALLFMWKRRQRTKANAEARRKEVEEYGYNPNNDPHGGVTTVGIGAARRSSNEEAVFEMAESNATGYRGWGSTNGGRKVPNIGSSVGTSAGMGFSDSGFPQKQGNVLGSGPDGYTGIATSPSASTFPTANSPSVDGSNAPLIHSNRPATADSSVIGAMNGPVSADNSGGIHRGISNASSNYSAMTQSDQSDLGQPLSQHDAQYYGVDDGYDEAYYSSRNPNHPYPGDHGYGAAPVIRDVSARRNTRIETPTDTHFPQQGNSGIAQNF